MSLRRTRAGSEWPRHSVAIASSPPSLPGALLVGTGVGTETVAGERIPADPCGTPPRRAHPAIGSRKPKTPENRGQAKAGDRGVEPRVAVLETTVLPIHQSPTEREL